MASTQAKFKISLIENGAHSLWRGIESFNDYHSSKDKMLLKDAILFLHHGVELLLKQILVRKSQYLIFEDLRDVSKKQKQANDQGKGLFFLPNPPKTISYEEALYRVEAFIKPAELTQKLRDQLLELNRVRNQVVHYEVTFESVKKVDGLLADIRDPLIDLFENQIGGIRKRQPLQAASAWEAVKKRVNQDRQYEEIIFQLLSKFDNQLVPCNIFNTDKDIKVPKYISVERNKSLNDSYPAYDFIAKSDVETWLIEVRTRTSPNFRTLTKLSFPKYEFQNIVCWMICFSHVSKELLYQAQRSKILLSGEAEIKELIQLFS